MKTLQKIQAARTSPSVRLGQYFCNTYIKGSWPELFYEEDEEKAAEIIRTWLVDHQYTDTMPPKVSISK